MTSWGGEGGVDRINLGKNIRSLNVCVLGGIFSKRMEPRVYARGFKGKVYFEESLKESIPEALH